MREGGSGSETPLGIPLTYNNTQSSYTIIGQTTRNVLSKQCPGFMLYSRERKGKRNCSVR